MPAQVAFYYYDRGGNTVPLGTVTQSNGGAWTLTSATAFGMTSGTYTLYAQAEDNYGIFGDPLALRAFGRNERKSRKTRHFRDSFRTLLP
jgi:hypothetical protein